MTEKSMPLVSIVIPSYNQGRFIESTIQSILKQDYKNLEIIVCDAQSCDETLDILERYRDQIRYISEKDHGQSNAINKGFEMSRGNIVTWLNSDDIYPDKRAISKIVSTFQSDGCDIVYGNFIEIDAEDRVLKFHRRPGYSYKRLLRIGYISQPATFLTRRVIEAMPVREDLVYALDLEYWLRAHSLRFKFRHINFLVAAERVHADAKCVKDNDKMIHEARMVRAAYGAKFGRMHELFRFIDRVLLYSYRFSGIFELLTYRSEPEKLTVPLNFEGSVKRTLSLRYH